MPIRPSAKAIIIQDNALLAIKKRDRKGDYYILPGGGQDYGEALPDALRRECQEEIGTTVDVGNLLFVRDYIGQNHEFADDESERQAHALELMFACSLPVGASVTQGSHPDEGQVGVEWLPLDRIHQFRLYPLTLRDHVANRAYQREQQAAYLGDVN